MRGALLGLSLLVVAMPAVATTWAHIELFRIAVTPTTTYDAAVTHTCIQTPTCTQTLFEFVPSTGRFDVLYSSGSMIAPDTLEVGVQGNGASIHLPVCLGENPLVIWACVSNGSATMDFLNRTPDVDGPDEIIVGYASTGSVNFRLDVRNGAVLNASRGQAQFYRLTELNDVHVIAGHPYVSAAALQMWNPSKGGVLAYSTKVQAIWGVQHASPLGEGDLCIRSCEAVVVGPAGRYDLVVAGATEISRWEIAMFADVEMP